MAELRQKREIAKGMREAANESYKIWLELSKLKPEDLSESQKKFMNDPEQPGDKEGWLALKNDTEETYEVACSKYQQVTDKLSQFWVKTLKYGSFRSEC